MTTTDLFPVKFDVSTAVLSEIQKYTALKIAGLDDKDGHKAVHEARMVCKNLRVQIEKRRVELKAGALEYGRRVDSEAKKYFDQIEPVESHLQAEEKKVDDEKERIRLEAIEAEKARIQSRHNRLFDLGCKFDGARFSIFDVMISLSDIQEASDIQFNSICNSIQAKLDSESEWLAAEEAERQAIAEKLESDRRALEEEKARIARQQDAVRLEQEDRERQHNAKIKAEREEIERERAELQAERDRDARERQRRIDAENARKQAEIDAKLRAERESQRAAELEALRPDAEKLLAWAGRLEKLEGPELKMIDAEKVKSRALDSILDISETIRRAVQSW
jgi:hypothetical protein